MILVAEVPAIPSSAVKIARGDARFWCTRVKTQRVKTSKNSAEEKCSQMIFQKISQTIEDITFTGFSSLSGYHFYWIFEYSGYLRNLRGRLLSSEKFSDVFTLWVFTLKPFPFFLLGARPRGRATTRASKNGSQKSFAEGPQKAEALDQRRKSTRKNPPKIKKFI